MVGHDQVQELAGAYALDAVTPDERREIEAHLQGCRECAELVAMLQMPVEALAQAAPVREPPVQARYRLLQAISRENAPRPSWFRLLWSPVALAGASLVLVLLIAALMLWQQSRLMNELASQRDFMTVVAYAQGSSITVHGTDLAPEAYGKLYGEQDDAVAALITISLPPLPAGREYSVWLQDRSGTNWRAGSFQPDDKGRAWLMIQTPQPLRAYDAVSITSETYGSTSATPTGPRVLWAQMK